MSNRPTEVGDLTIE